MDSINGPNVINKIMLESKWSNPMWTKIGEINRHQSVGEKYAPKMAPFSYKTVFEIFTPYV